VHNWFICIDQIIGSIVGVILAFVLTLKTIWLIKQINRYGNTGGVLGTEKVNYVIWQINRYGNTGGVLGTEKVNYVIWKKKKFQ